MYVCVCFSINLLSLSCKTQVFVRNKCFCLLFFLVNNVKMSAMNNEISFLSTVSIQYQRIFWHRVFLWCSPHSWGWLSSASGLWTVRWCYAHLPRPHRILIIFNPSWGIIRSEAVTFSHVSGEPVSHVPSPEVKHGSELVDMTQGLVQSHHLSVTVHWTSNVLMNSLCCWVGYKLLAAQDKPVCYTVYMPTPVYRQIIRSGSRSSSPRFFAAVWRIVALHRTKNE